MPYIFRDGRLIANDWGFLGGIKSVGDPNNDEIGNWRSIKRSVTKDDIAIALVPRMSEASISVSNAQAKDKAARKKSQTKNCTNTGWGQQTCIQGDSDPWGINELGYAEGSAPGYAKMRKRAVEGCMATKGFLRNE